MNTKIDCLVINPRYKKSYTLSTKCRPVIGDSLPLNHLQEKVISVMFVTPQVVKENPDSENFDLLVVVE